MRSTRQFEDRCQVSAVSVRKRNALERTRSYNALPASNWQLHFEAYDVLMAIFWLSRKEDGRLLSFQYWLGVTISSNSCAFGEANAYKRLPPEYSSVEFQQWRLSDRRAHILRQKSVSNRA